MRKPNELMISAVLLEEFFRVGYERPPYRVKEGPTPEAHIIGAHYDSAWHCVVLEYDRSVDETLMETLTP